MKNVASHDNDVDHFIPNSCENFYKKTILHTNHIKVLDVVLDVIPAQENFLEFACSMMLKGHLLEAWLALTIGLEVSKQLISKRDWIEQPLVCTRQNLKPGYFDHCNLGDTTLRATALDLRSEDYE